MFFSPLKPTVLLICLGLLTACSDSPSSTGDAKPTAGTADNPAENKFAIAATVKIMAANPGLSEAKSRCVVQAITQNGQFGLGEINQMKLDKAGMASNRSDLNQAYQDALASCQ